MVVDSIRKGFNDGLGWGVDAVNNWMMQSVEAANDVDEAGKIAPLNADGSTARAARKATAATTAAVVKVLEGPSQHPGAPRVRTHAAVPNNAADVRPERQQRFRCNTNNATDAKRRGGTTTWHECWMDSKK